MARLTGIFVYPLKSARGISLPEATLSDRGLQHDRRFLIVDEAGRFVTQRELPQLALVGTRLGASALTLSHPDAGSLEVPLRPDTGELRRVRIFTDTTDALDLGAAPRRFLSAALGRPLALVYMPDEARRAVDPKYAEAEDIVSFADGFPFLLTSESSLEALNRELAEPVPMARFRPNFVIAGTPAYAEDTFDGLALGDVRFRALKPSARCVIVNTDQTTGARAPGALEGLMRSHVIGKRPIFGQNLVARSAGIVRVGDEVTLSPPT